MASRLVVLLAALALPATACGTSAPAPAASADPALVASYLSLADKFEADYATAAANFKQRSIGADDFGASRQLYSDLALAYLNFANAALDLKWQGAAADEANSLGKGILALARQLDQMSRWDITQFASYEKRVEAGNDDVKKLVDPVRKDVATLSADLGLPSPRPEIPTG